MKRHAGSRLREQITLQVRPAPGRPDKGLIACRDGAVWRCALGAAGLTARKREGDGATPAGRMRLGQVLYRPDRVARPRTLLPVRALRPEEGWCDAPGDRNYNRPVRLPYPASAERLWRDDHLYDLVVVFDYNIRPRTRGRGSAIFMHLARDGLAPTEGCLALGLRDLRALLARCAPGSTIAVSV